MSGFSLFTPIHLLPIMLLVLVFCIPALVMWLWNITMPQVFGLRPLLFWQAFRLVLLAAIVLGGARAL